MTPHPYTPALLQSFEKGIVMQAAKSQGKRLTTRVTEHVQEQLQLAANLVGSTVNQFVVQAAIEKAERVIESESLMILTRRESLRVIELLENPPAPNDKFRTARDHYMKVVANACAATE